MKVLFLTLAKVNSIEDKSIYQDLLRKFRNEGHSIVILTPSERRFKQGTQLINEENVSILKVWTPNIQKTNILEKGIGTLVLEWLFGLALLKYFKRDTFDLIIYSTPPITFTGLIKYLKKRMGAKTYLLLKDIFPQNAVDLKMISNTGFIYKYFRKREIELYKISDFIGCMSKANMDFVLKHNSYLPENKVEVNPNSIFLEQKGSVVEDFKTTVRGDIPLNKKIFLYGGNLGKPQGIDFLLDVISNCKDLDDIFFIIVGSGTESNRILKWFEIHKPANALLIDELPKKEYDSLLKLSQVGLVFLDPNFTIPNYPSRILPYMENKIPILFATDLNTDVGIEAELWKYGLWCESGNLQQFKNNIKQLAFDSNLRKEMGENGYKRLKADFNVNYSYQVIMKHFQNENIESNVITE